MASIPKKVEDRLKSEIRKYKIVLESAQRRDINETDTVKIVNDILADVFGYDRYEDITSEFLIRNTYCDLAIKMNGKVNYLIEVKAIGAALKENHVRQAINYAGNEGVDWVLLTNGIHWKVFKMTFHKPIEFELVFELNLIECNPKEEHAKDMLYALCKEGVQKSAIDGFHKVQQAVNRYTVAAVIQSDDVLSSIRKKIRNLHEGVKVDNARLADLILKEILKRDVVEDPLFEKAVKKIDRSKTKEKKKEGDLESKQADAAQPATIEKNENV